MKTAKKTGMGILVGTRGMFNPDLAIQGRKALLEKVRKIGIEPIILSETDTPNGVVETVDDAAKYAKFFNSRRDEIAGVIVSLPNFGDELGIVNVFHLADLHVPILVQAADDEVNKVGLKERRDAFCGKLSVCNNLWQYGFDFTDTSTHTCSVESEAFSDDLLFFDKVCRIFHGMKKARIGAAGTRPTPFQTMRISEKLLQASGITVVPTDLSEIIGRANRIAQKEQEVKRKIEEIGAYGRIPSSIPAEAVRKQAQLILAIEEWIDENKLDAMAMQCWTSIQQNFGGGACLTLSMMNEKLLPAACETDIGGLLGMMALRLAMDVPAALLDWNNNYGNDRDMCVNTHCSACAKSFLGSTPEIATQSVLGAALGEHICFGAVKGKAKPGAFTFARVSTDDRSGKIRAYTGEGEFTNDPFNMDGGIAVCRIPRLQKLMKFMCKRGFEHHTGMARGRCADAIEEAFGTYFKWDVYNHAASARED